ncbi:MAG: 30S ribosomal protein S20 [Halanaerobiales bacterium]
MPTIESAKKRVKTNAKKRKINRKWKDRLKNTIKEYKDLIQDKNIEEAEAYLKETFKVIDKCASKNLIHQNKAARKKSQFTKMLNELKENQE